MDGLELEQKTPRRTRRWRIWAAAALLLALVLQFFVILS